MKLTAKFDNKALLTAALGELASRDSVIYSAKPVEFEPGVLDRPSRMSFVAVVCAVAFGLGMTLFMLWTQGDYPLVTGGMPLNSLWPIGVITYETTMLGAIFGILASFLIEGRFFRKHSAPREALDSDQLFLQVPCKASEFESLGEQLRAQGAISVEKGQA